MACCVALHTTAQIIFDRYTTDNGLSNNNCNSIIQDEDGFTWIATASGLNRFDGNDFVKYYSTGPGNQLPSNVINKIVCLPLHRIAAATNEGLAILDTRTGAVQQLILPAPDELKAMANSVNDILPDKKGNLIAATNGGVYVFNAAFKLIFRYDAFTIRDIGKKRLLFSPTPYLLPDGRVLIKAPYGFLYILNIEKKTLDPINDVPGKELDLLRPWNGIEGYVAGNNSDGQFFLIRNFPLADSLFIIDLPHQKAASTPLAFSIVQQINWASRIIPVNDTLLAITAGNHNGIYLAWFDKHNLAAASINRVLPGNHCTSIFMDKDNRMWAGSFAGIFKQSLSKAFFNNCTPPFDSAGDAADKGIGGIIHYQHKYFITEVFSGVLVYDDNLHFIQSISFEKVGKRNLPWDIIYYAKDTLLVGNLNGALLLNTLNYSLTNFWKPGMPQAIDSNPLVTAFINGQHQLWMGIGTGNGVFRMNLLTHQWTHFSPKIPGAVFKLRYPVSIAEDSKGDTWMSGFEGITRWSRQKQTFDTMVTKIPGIGDINGFWTSIVTDQKNNLWAFEKNTVLVKWDLTTKRFTTFKIPGNIPPVTANLVKGPWHNRLWIPTDKGLLSFNLQNEQFTLIQKSDGLWDDDITSLYFDTSANRLFVGFNNAFTWFYPEDVLKQRKPVSTLITDIRKIGDSLSYAGDTALSFSYKENSFTIGFTGIDFDDGENNTYAYRLFENKPGPFISIGQQKVVTFANLKPGHYTFQVKTILSDGTQSTRPTALRINISFPFYERWWFYLLCATGITALFFSLYRYRINQLVKVQKIRNSIAGDLHDDIGSSISSISIMSELAKEKSPEVASLLDAISENAATIQENMSDIVWAINPKNDRFENVLQRMNLFASEILEAKNIELSFINDDALSSVKLPMGQRKNLYLFFKEAINNAAKHSRAKKVSVHIFQQNNYIEMEISDNGKGFGNPKPSNGNGMDTLKKRAAEMGGTVNIFSAVNKGVQIVLRFKIT